MLRKVFKKIGRPVMKLLYGFLMRGSRSHPGRRLFGTEELRLLREALLSQNLFCMDGAMVSGFEREFATEYGVPYAVASTSGTAAIHAALGALDLNAGDEVITAPITDLGTIIPILYQNALPVFADTDDTLNMDPADVEKKINSRTRAIIVVHLFGNPCDMDRMLEIAKRHGIPLIEDCAQAHLTPYKDRYVGTIGDIGCFSFQQSKHMTTGDGGMTITSNKKYYERMKLFVDKGYARKGWGARAYLFHAPNYRMNELTGAVGRAQLKKVKAVVEKRNRMGVYLTQLLSGTQGLTPVPPTPGARHSYWLYPFRLHGIDIEPFAKELIREGIYAMPGYTGKAIYLCTESLASKKTYGTSGVPFSLNKDKTYEYKAGLCPRAEKSLESLICIPWDESWSMEKVRKTAQTIRACVEKLSKAGPSISAPVPTAPPIIPSPTRANKIRIGIIGCGQMGRWHLNAYKQNPRVQLAAYADIDPAKSDEFAKEAGGKAYSSYKEMIEKETLNGVSLCTVPATHKEIALDLLEKNLHVLCEKPLAISANQARQMTDKARQKNLLLLTAFKFRFFEEIQAAKELLEKGGLGDILSFRLMFGGYTSMEGTWYARKELSGGGVLMDNGPHAADIVQYLLGEIDELRAQKTPSPASDGVEHTTKIDLKLKNGALGTVDLSWSIYAPSKTYLEIYGEEGTALLDPEGLTYKFKTWSDWKRLPNRSTVPQAFERQIHHFIEAISNRKTTLIDNEAGLRSQIIIETAYRSLKEGRPMPVGETA